MLKDKFQGSYIMRKLPVGIQDFGIIRRGSHVYVDKTKIIHKLVQGEGAYFLSRPRRFGKSLLCSTIKAIFENKRELFQDIAGFPALEIDSLDWEWKKHPVILLSLNIANFSSIDVLISTLDSLLNQIAKANGLELRDELINLKFKNLIIDLHDKYNERVVILIDEYDKPLLDAIGNNELHVQIRNELKGFYGVIKASGEYLRFVFLTGITKFAHISIFSDLNNIIDLTLKPDYADICGLTQEEVEQHFEQEIAYILNETGKSRETYLQEMKEYYNGYRFSEEPLTLYNPFGLLNHFTEKGKFKPYWYITGTPTFLIELIKKQKIDILNLGELSFGLHEFYKFDIENLDAIVMLYQTGYLTISDYNDERAKYFLDYPNLEVSSSFSKSLIQQYFEVPSTNSNALIAKLPDALLDGDVKEMIEILRSFLAAVPYDIIKDTENYYQTVVHLIFSMLGLNCRSEVRIAHGRINTIVETKKYVYCFEFKLNEPAEKALAQINEKDYLLPWRNTQKQLFKIGISFDEEKRNITDWCFSE